ncbi:MAG: UMP kinase [Magnetococcales bacterium]|nr:UMP kinase [Magnetococcales bacterium]
MQHSTPPQRLLVKLSGEALMGSQGYGIDAAFIGELAAELVAVQRTGCQMALVVGGGNIFRGLSGLASGMNRSSADQMGMLATVMNALALQQAIEQQGGIAVVQSALAMPQVVPSFARREAMAELAVGHMVIFAAGTGNPFFTTDTAAALRAAEIGADLLLKATKVDGVYDADPRRHADARRFDHLTYDQVLAQRLEVMDLTAITLCRENRIPLRIFSMIERGALLAVARGEPRGTIIQDDYYG